MSDNTRTQRLPDDSPFDKSQPNNPLHGVTLKAILKYLVAERKGKKAAADEASEVGSVWDRARRSE